MTDDRLPAAVDQVRADPAAEVGWEPPDWSAVLRRRRLRQWGGAACLLLIAVVVVPLVRILLERPPGVSWGWLALALGMAGRAGWSQFTARGRAWWEEETRNDVRIGHALRHHVGIGEADRELVTERAEKIVSWTWARLGVGLLLIALVAGLLASAADETAVRAGFAVLGLLGVGAVVRAERRRVAEARSWLADPLPSAQGTPWT